MKFVTFSFIFASFMFIVFSQQLTVKEISDTLKNCYLKDNSKLRECLIDYFNESIPLLAKGIGNSLKMDPLELENNMTLPDNGILLTGLLAVYSATTKGLSQSVIRDTVTDLSKHTITVYATHPQLIIGAKYHFNASIMFVPVIGKGDFTAIATDCNSTVKFQIEREKLGVKLTKATVSMDIKHIKLEITGLESSPEVIQAIHKLLNDNASNLHQEIRPVMELDMGKQIEKIYRDLFKEFPVQLLD